LATILQITIEPKIEIKMPSIEKYINKKKFISKLSKEGNFKIQIEDKTIIPLKIINKVENFRKISSFFEYLFIFLSKD